MFPAAKKHRQPHRPSPAILTLSKPTPEGGSAAEHSGVTLDLAEARTFSTIFSYRCARVLLNRLPSITMFEMLVRFALHHTGSTATAWSESSLLSMKVICPGMTGSTLPMKQERSKQWEAKSKIKAYFAESPLTTFYIYIYTQVQSALKVCSKNANSNTHTHTHICHICIYIYILSI